MKNKIFLSLILALLFVNCAFAAEPIQITSIEFTPLDNRRICSDTESTFYFLPELHLTAMNPLDYMEKPIDSETLFVCVSPNTYELESYEYIIDWYVSRDDRNTWELITDNHSFVLQDELRPDNMHYWYKCVLTILGERNI